MSAGYTRFSLFMIVLLAMNPARATEPANNSDAGLGIYSDLSFNAGEGERYGLQIVLIRYLTGYTPAEKILWRSAAGKLNAPLLLDVKKVGDTLKVIVPNDDDFFGEWSLNVKGPILYAFGPRGLKFNLVKLPIGRPAVAGSRQQ